MHNCRETEFTVFFSQICCIIFEYVSCKGHAGKTGFRLSAVQAGLRLLSVRKIRIRTAVRRYSKGQPEFHGNPVLRLKIPDPGPQIIRKNFLHIEFF